MSPFAESCLKFVYCKYYRSLLGMQSGAIYGDKAWGVGLEEKFLPEYLKEYGYKTHAIGKVSSIVILCVFLKVYFSLLLVYDLWRQHTFS